ncbi:MAG: DUF3124 domain-containing protein, partial [Microcystaceae cyanobacterium]
MKIPFYFCLAITALVFISCTSQNTSQKQQSATHQAASSQPKKVVLDDKIKIVMGQTIYVPIYSHIYFENSQKTFDLTATLSIRNTDLT